MKGNVKSGMDHEFEYAGREEVTLLGALFAGGSIL